MNNPGPLTGKIEIKDIRHVLDLLISNLYGGDPHLTIRELIQNAHDAIISKYKIPPLDYNQDRITIEINNFSQPPYLEITDTGVGMDEESLRENLGKIGDSEKMAMALKNPAIIGRFGIGFLSSFIVSEQVEVFTRTERQPTKVWRWATDDRTTWAMQERPSTEMPNAGTRVRLYFSPGYQGNMRQRISEMQSEEGLRKLVARFAYLLPIPIEVRRHGDRGGVANIVRPPWGSLTDADNAYKALFNGKDTPLHTHRISRADGPFKAFGVLYFQPVLTFRSSLRLYVRRMLISEEDTTLLPEYAVFATGFIESPNPDVDLARRNVSQFDPAYQWLRRVVREEFERAFIEFAESSPESMAVKLWPRVDNSFITRLLHSSQEDDELEEQTATSFLINAGRHIPFYQLDVVSGGFGQPVWKSIHELISSARQRAGGGRLQASSPNKVAIPYTESKAPIEKDFLVNTYGEVIDVGREEKAHGSLMSLMATHNKDFPDFEVVAVTADRFSAIAPEEMQSWASVVNVVQENVSFRGRDHRVQVEQFEPINNPVTITDTKIDSEEVTQLRKLLSEGPLSSKNNTITMVADFLDKIGSSGGLVAIHLNAGNPVMLELRDAVNDPDREISTTAVTCLRYVVWRAILDYFGWRSTRDMVALERELGFIIIRDLSKKTANLQQLQERGTKTQIHLEQTQKELQKLAEQQQRATAALHDIGNVVVGFIDIVASTDAIMANAQLDHAPRIRLMADLVTAIQKQISDWATPVSFTGDGLLFYIKAQQDRQVADLLSQLRMLGDILESERRQDGAIAPFLPASKSLLRIALSWGPVHQGLIGPTSNIIGWPVVEAARLAAEKEFFLAGQVAILATEQSVDAGIQTGFWKHRDWQHVTDNWIPRGFGNHPVTVYRHARS
ncbi:MAG: ATP-binding protein [Magnetococcus sp. MYC-9]